MTFEEDRPGSNTIFVLKAQKSMTSLVSDGDQLKIKSDYFNVILRKEQELSNFMSLYQKDHIYPKYMNIQRTCKLKELNHDDETIKEESSGESF